MARRSWILLAATAALWGASYLFIKVALDELSEGAIVFVRVLLGAAVLVPLAARAGALRSTRGRWRWLTVITLVQVVAPFLLIVYGENHVPSALAGILVSSAPIFTALLATRFDHAERLRGWSFAGIVLGIAGVTLLFGADLSGSGDAVAGGLMILLASLCYAAGSLLIKHRAVEHREGGRDVGHDRRAPRAEVGDQQVVPEERDAGAPGAERQQRPDRLRAGHL